MFGLRNNKINKTGFIFIGILANFYCGDTVLDKMESFQPNAAPDIVVFTSDSPGGATLLPNQVFHIHAEASDINGNAITFKYDSEVGSFSGQLDTETTSDVTFTLPGILNSGFVAIATLTVTDEKGASNSMDLDMGSGRTGPALTAGTATITPGDKNATSYPWLTDNDCTSFQFSADADGFFQISLLTNPDAACAMDTSVNGNFKFYTKDMPIQVFVHGPSGKSSCSAGLPDSVYQVLTNGTANNDQKYKICAGVRDALSQDSFISYDFTLDNVPSVSTPNITLENQTLNSPKTIAMNCSDTTPCQDVSYTLDYAAFSMPAGITPDFAGTGTVLSYSNNTSPGFTIGNRGDGHYKLKYITRDAAGNQEVKTIDFAVNQVSPVITSSVTNTTLTSTGDIAFNVSDIVWQTNDYGTYQVLVNPVDCNTGGTLISGGSIAAINQNIVSSVLVSDLPNEGANSIYICVDDGFTVTPKIITLYRDNTPPSQSTTFGGGTFVGAPSGTFSCADSSSCKISYSLVYNANSATAPAAGALVFPGTLNGPTSAALTLGSGDGTYTVQYQAEDSVGNRAVAPSSFSFSIDAIQPVITTGAIISSATANTGVTTLNPVNNASITWSTNQDSSYYLMLNAACGTTTLGTTNVTAGAGTANESGTVMALGQVVSTLSASTSGLAVGTNTVNICAFDGFTTATQALPIVRDDTAAVTSVSPNIHNGSFAAWQSVTPTCTDAATSCSQIRYIETWQASLASYPAGVTPDFATSSGTLITSGTSINLGTDPAIPATPTTRDGAYTTTFVSVDAVGNIEAVKTINYKINSTLPVMSLTTPGAGTNPTNLFVTGNTATSNAGFGSSNISWTATWTGGAATTFQYYVLYNDTICAGTGGALIPKGTTTITTVAAASLVAGVNTVNICATTDGGANFASLMVNITRDDVPPTITASALTALPFGYSTSQNVTFTCTDSASGCSNMIYTAAASAVDTANYTPHSTTAPAGTAPVYAANGLTATTGTFRALPDTARTLGNWGDGAYTVKYIAQDKVGNQGVNGALIGSVAAFSFGVNATQPAITFTSGPSNAIITSTGSATFNNTNLVWLGNQAGQTYVAVKGSVCPSPWSTAPPSKIGTSTGVVNTAITTAILATDAQLTANAANTITLCVNDGFTTASLQKSVTLDNTAPTSSITIGGITYSATGQSVGTAFASSQSATFNCSDTAGSTCTNIGYTYAYAANTTTPPAGVTPTFSATAPQGLINGASGTVLLGTSGDGTYRISRLSKDGVVNQEAVKTLDFSVNAIAPSVAITAGPTNATVSTTGSTITPFGTTYQSTSITWKEINHSSVPYYITVNLACGTTTAGTTNATGINVSGTSPAAGTTVTTTINASAAAPWVVGANTIRMCVFDGFTTASATATVNLDNTAPLAPTLTQTALGATTASYSVTGAADMTHYSYTLSSTGATVYGAYTLATAISLTGLTAGTQYTLTVTGYDAQGNASTTNAAIFTPGYTISINSTGVPAVLAGNELKLTLNTSAEVLTIASSGLQTFTTRLSATAAYSIATTPPVTSPAYICSFVDNAWGAMATANKTLNVNCVSGYQYAYTIAPSNPTGNRSITTDTLYTSNLITGTNGVFGMVKVGNILYFTRSTGHQIQAVDVSTSALTTFVIGSGVAGHIDGVGTAAVINDPRGLTTDGSNLYFSEYTGNYIRKVNIASKTVTTLAGTGVNSSTDNTNPLAATVGGPVGLDIWWDATNKTNYLIFADYNTSKVRKMNLSTGAVATIAGTGVAGYLDNATGTLAQFYQLHALVVDSINNVAYVADGINVSNFARIRKITLTTNAVTTVAGSGISGFKDGTALQAQLNNPGSLTIYKDKLLFYDMNNASLRTLNITSGIVTTISSGVGAGGNVVGDADTARYNSNGTILVSDNGDTIYFADAYNNTIRKISNQLAAHYTFDDAGSATAQDYSGNFRDATMYNAPTAAYDEKGAANAAYRFNGTTQYIKYPAVVTSAVDNITMSAWIKLESYGTDWKTIISNGNGTSNGYMMMINPTGFAHLAEAGVGGYYTSTYKVPLNKWTHIAMTRSAGTWTAYIDGNAAAFNVAPPAPVTPTTSTSIGMSGGTPTYYFPGLISDARIYTRALAAREIKRLSSQVPEGLVRYYPMDGGITDATIFQKTGTVPARAGGSYASAINFDDRFGRTTSAYKFDGTDDYIYAADTNLPGRTAAQTSGGKAPRTACTWMMTGSPATNQGVMTYGTAIINQYYSMILWGGTYFMNSWGNNLNTGSPISDEWAHFCTTYDGASTTAIYVNGALLGSSTIASTWDTILTGTFYIGYEPGNAIYLNGSLDDVRIYGRVLSANEITALSEPSGNTMLLNSYTGNDVHIKHSILPGSNHTYIFPVALDSIYNVWWDDSASGSGTTTANVTVSAKYLTSGTAIFTNIDSAYLNSAVRRFRATANDTVLVTVNNPGAATGAYGIKANDFANFSFTNATALATQLYYFSAVAGKTYSIWWDDSFQGSGTKTFDLYLGASGQGAALTLAGVGSDSGYTTPYTFTATATGTVTITVRAYSTAGGTGTFGLMVTKP